MELPQRLTCLVLTLQVHHMPADHSVHTSTVLSSLFTQLLNSESNTEPSEKSWYVHLLGQRLC